MDTPQPDENTKFPVKPHEYERVMNEKRERERRKGEIERRENENKRKREIVSILGGIKPFEDFTFEKFRREEAPEAYEAAVRFNPGTDNLFFYGPNDLGKSHLLKAVAHRCLDFRKSVVCWLWPNISNQLRILEGKFDFEGKQRLIDSAIEAEVLAIEEFGFGPVSDSIVSFWFEILEGRVNARRNGFIGASNLPLATSRKDMLDIRKKWGGKIYSRVMRLCPPDKIIFFSSQKGSPAP